MGMNAAGTASVIWTILISLSLLVYYLVFTRLRGGRGGQKQATDSNDQGKEVEAQARLSNGGGGLLLKPLGAESAYDMSTSLDSTSKGSPPSYEEGISLAMAYQGETIKDYLASFGSAVNARVFEYYFENAKTYYRLAISQTTFTLVILYHHDGVNINTSFAKFQKTPRAYLKTVSVPIDTLKDMVSTSRPAILNFTLLWGRMKELAWHLDRLMPHLCFLFSLLLVIFSFYVPLYTDNGYYNDVSEEGNGAKTASSILFVFTLLLLLCTLRFSYTIKPSNAALIGFRVYTVLIATTTVLALYLLIISVSGTDDNDSGNSDEANGSYRLGCECKDDSNDRRRLDSGTDYKATCDSDTTIFNYCDRNCSVCGETYYGVFVLFTLFIATYYLIALWLLFSHYLEGKLLNEFAFPKLIFEMHSEVDILGSSVHGYPLCFFLRLDQVSRLEGELQTLREKRLQNDTGSLSVAILQAFSLTLLMISPRKLLAHLTDLLDFIVSIAISLLEQIP